jgi:hypothetical protein
LTAPDTTGVVAPTGADGVGTLRAAEAAGPPDGEPVGAGLADGTGPAVPEPVPALLAPVAPAPELGAAEATGVAAEATGDAAEATGDAGELTAEATGDAAELIVEVTVEAVDVCVVVSGASAAVAAWAGRENNSMIAKIPAAASAACTATRAMRRAIGCSMSSSTRRVTGPLAYPWRRQQTSCVWTCCSVTTVQCPVRSDKGSRSDTGRASGKGETARQGHKPAALA